MPSEPIELVELLHDIIDLYHPNSYLLSSILYDVIDSNPFPILTRREALAACGTAMLGGCSDNLVARSSQSIDCSSTDASWPMYAYNAAHTSYLSSRNLPPATAQVHRLSQTGTQISSDGSTGAPPVIKEGMAYVAGDVRIEARDIKSGAREWETDPEDSIETSPVLACETVYVSTPNETLALAQEDGSVIWRADRGVHISPSSSPVVVDDTIYVASEGISALNAETGTERWHASTKHRAHGVAIGNHVYVGSGGNGRGAVTAFTREGNDRWHTTDLGPIHTTPVVVNDTIYAVSKQGTVTALSAADGSIQWQANIESGDHEQPAVGDSRVVVGAGNGTQTMAFDAATGDRLWTFETGVSRGAPVITGEQVLATGANTGIYVLDAATGDRMRHWAVENVGSQPVLTSGRLFYRGWDVSDIFVIE